MKRKLIKQGTSSLTISLPTSWTKKYNLKGGDEIFLNEDENSIILSTKESIAGKKSTIDVSRQKKSLIWVYLNDLYIRGDDEIEVRFANMIELELIQKISNTLIGFAIVEQHKNSCTLKEISTVSEESFDALLRRIFLLTLMAAEEGHMHLQKNEIKEVNELRNRDEQINRLVSFCLRMLNKKGHSDSKKTSIYITIIYLLEQIGDEYARCFREIKQPVSKKAISLLKRTIDLNREFYEVFYQFDKEKIAKMLDKRDKLRDEVDSLLASAKKKDITVLFRVKKIAELIMDVVKIEIITHI